MSSTPSPCLPSSAAPSFSTAVSSPHLLASATAGSNEKQLQRERERLSRKKRLDKREKMQAYISALERTALAIRVVPDADTIWDEFLDDDTKRIRSHLRRLIPVADEVKRLTNEKAQLQRLLTEHELARRALGSLVKAMKTVDKWGTSCAMWKALTSIHFRPLTTSECIKQMNAALMEMTRYVVSQDKQSTGVTFMGWQENRRVVPTESSLQFSLHKIYRGSDVDHHIQTMWRVHTEVDVYSKIMLGGRARASLEVLQKLSPTAWVVRIAESYDMSTTIHGLFLVFRVDTDQGAIQCLHAIEGTNLQSAILKAGDAAWMKNYIWMRWEVLDPSKDRCSTDYSVSVGGCLRGAGDEYLHLWLFELVIVVVRCEDIAVTRPMLNFSL